MISGSYCHLHASHVYSLTDFDALISTIGEITLSKVDSVAVRLNADLASMLKRKSNFEEVREIAARVNRARFLVFWFNARTKKHELAELSSTAGFERLQAAELKTIMKSEIQQLLEWSGDLPLLKSSGTAFVAPSGKLCDGFFRAANIFTTPESVEAMAFWLLPIFITVQYVIVDSWTIAPVAYCLQNFLLGSSGVGTSVEVSGFRSHPYADDNAARLLIRNISRKLSPTDRVLILGSVVSSGGFETRVQELLMEAGVQPDKVQFTYMFCLSDTNVVFAERALFRIEEQSCSVDAVLLAERRKLQIDPILFYPRPSPEHIISIKPKHFGLKYKIVSHGKLMEENEPYRSLLTEYSDHGALSFHKNIGLSHFPYYIDVGQLTKSDAFRQRSFKSSKQMERHGRWSRLVYCRSDAAFKLAVMLKEFLDIDLCSVQDLRSQVEVDDSLLIVSDVVDSGATIIGESAKLREAVSGVAIKSIDYWVPLLRGTRDDLASFEIAVSKGNGWSSQVEVCDELPLPNTTICPWCAEADLLDRLVGRFGFMDPPKWIVERSIQVGSDKNFSPIDIKPTGEIIEVGYGSPVFPQGWSAKTFCFFIAVALESMRRTTAPDERLSFDFFHSTVLDTNALKRYNEWSLRSGFLRVVPSVEWGWQNQEELVKLLCRLLRQPDVPGHFVWETALLLSKHGVVPAWTGNLREELMKKHDPDLHQMLGES